MKVYQVSYEYSWDAPRVTAGTFTSLEEAEAFIESTKDPVKYPHGFHGDTFDITEISLDEPGFGKRIKSGIMRRSPEQEKNQKERVEKLEQDMASMNDIYKAVYKQKKG